MSNTEVDRRRFPRTYLPIAASLFSGTTKVGDYLVADLSAGGALFAHGRAVEIGARLRVMFVGDGVEGLSVTAMVKRCELFRGESWSVAVEFGALPPSLVDALQDLVLDGMVPRGAAVPVWFPSGENASSLMLGRAPAPPVWGLAGP